MIGPRLEGGGVPPPPALSEAVRLVVRDLERATGVAVTTSLDPSPDDELAWRVTVRFEDGSAAGFEVLSDPPAALVVSVADAIQTIFIEELAKLVPVCPGHSHPMVPVQSAEGAAWSCPSSGDRLWPIGDYEPA